MVSGVRLLCWLILLLWRDSAINEKPRSVRRLLCYDGTDFSERAGRIDPMRCGGFLSREAYEAKRAVAVDEAAVMAFSNAMQ